MRGSSLSNPIVVDALRPFVVTSYNSAKEIPLPEDILAAWTACRARPGSNICAIVFDTAGRPVHWFGGFPGNGLRPMGHSSEELARYFRDEIRRGASKFVVPNVKPSGALPDVEGSGVRIFIRLPERRDGFGAPLVEPVAMTDADWRRFAYGDRVLDAESVRSWLAVIYPPAMRKSDLANPYQPYKTYSAALTLKRAGADTKLRYGILSGTVKMVMDDGQFTEGKLEILFAYSKENSTVKWARGTFEGGYPVGNRPDARGRLKLVAAIESRPE